MEEGSEKGEMRKQQSDKTMKVKRDEAHVDSEFDEPNNPSSYDGEILYIETQEEEEAALEAKTSYLKKALSGKLQFIIKKRLIYADMAWGTEFQIQVLRDPTTFPTRENFILEQLVKAQDPSTLQGFKKATDKLMNDSGRYSQSVFSTLTLPICPVSSSLSPNVDISAHSNISQLVESL